MKKQMILFCPFGLLLEARALQNIGKVPLYSAFVWIEKSFSVLPGSSSVIILSAGVIWFLFNFWEWFLL